MTRPCWLVILLMLSACGRLGFEPLGDAKAEHDSNGPGGNNTGDAQLDGPGGTDGSVM
mgnify:CR=1 FL=1